MEKLPSNFWVIWIFYFILSSFFSLSNLFKFFEEFKCFSKFFKFLHRLSSSILSIDFWRNFEFWVLNFVRHLSHCVTWISKGIQVMWVSRLSFSNHLNILFKKKFSNCVMNQMNHDSYVINLIFSVSFHTYARNLSKSSQNILKRLFLLNWKTLTELQ